MRLLRPASFYVQKESIMESSNDSLAGVPMDVFEQCISPCLDDRSVIALASSSRKYTALFLANTVFSRHLWNTLCTRRWQCIQFNVSNSSEINYWLEEYRRRFATDVESWSLMKEMKDIKVLDYRNEELYSRFVAHGMDAMDIFQRRKGLLDWQLETMPEAVEKGLIRFHLCQKFRSSGSFDSDVPLENGAMWIVQYLISKGFSDTADEPESFSGIQYFVENELDALAIALLQRLRRTAGVVEGRQGGTHQEFPLRLVLEEMKYIFDKNHEDHQKPGKHIRPFSGNDRNYYSYHNSFIHSVLATRRGIPITLAIIYSAIVRRATGVQMRAVNLPGHFMIAASVDNEDNEQESGLLFVDAFHGGKILNEAQVRSMITTAYDIPWDPQYLSNVPNTAVWKRIAMNLANSADLLPELASPTTSLILMGFNHNGTYDRLGQTGLLSLIHEADYS